MAIFDFAGRVRGQPGEDGCMSTPGAEIHGAQRRHSAPLRGPRAGRHANGPHSGPLRSLPPERCTLRDPLIRSSLALRRDRAARPPATRVQFDAVSAARRRPAWRIVPLTRHSVGTTVRSATVSRNAEVTCPPNRDNSSCLFSRPPALYGLAHTDPTTGDAGSPASPGNRLPRKDSDRNAATAPISRQAVRADFRLIQKSHPAILAVTGSDHFPGGFLFPEWVAFVTGIRIYLPRLLQVRVEALTIGVHERHVRDTLRCAPRSGERSGCRGPACRNRRTVRRIPGVSGQPVPDRGPRGKIGAARGSGTGDGAGHR